MRRALISAGNFSNSYARMFGGKPVKTVTFIVTNDCNLRCTYCYEHNKRGAEMTLETAKKAVDLMFESDADGGIWINPIDADGVIMEFIGGEPLMKIGLIDAVMDYFLQKAVKHDHRWMTRYMISMSSNGLLYHTEPVQRFLRKWEGRVSLGITVDGDKETHDACRVDKDGNGSYDLAAAAFEDVLAKYGIDITKFTLAPGNVGRIFKAHTDMIERYDLCRVTSNVVFEEGWTVEHARTMYFELKKLVDWLRDTGRLENVMLLMFDRVNGQPLDAAETQNWCGGTGKMLSFDVDGAILPCLRYSAMSLGGDRPPLVVGHVDTGIGATREQRDTIDMLEAITRQSQSSEECLECPIASGCAWCSAYNYEVYGTPDKRATFICCMHKARVLASSYYWNTLFRREGSGERFRLNIPREWALEIVPESEYDMLVGLSGKE